MFIPKFSVFVALLIIFTAFQEPVLAIKKSYVVYLGGHSHGRDATTADLRRVKDSHHQLLGSVLGSAEKAKDSIFYSYKRHINGFAAILEEEEAAELARQPGVVSVFLNKPNKLHTTHSWDFLRLEREGKIHPSSLWKKARFGEDTIIANLDTGVWPESKSFSDDGMGPIPSNWKGVCQFPSKKLCNKKLIGARYFDKGYLAYYELKNLNVSLRTTRDPVGHGSHTLSTAGGSFVPGASILHGVNGTAKGGSPRARVAAYKVCWSDEDCFDADIMKGFDMAIHDGVDVISVSLGSGPTYFFNESISIGAFHAAQKGITVVASAGNSGPKPGTVANTAPWIITVGASTIDRKFQSNVVLKSGKILEGLSLSNPLPEDSYYPLISASDAKASNASVKLSKHCQPGTLDPEKVKGKILVCLRGGSNRVDKGEQALLAGAAGMILCNANKDDNDLVADAHMLPATHINFTDGQILFNYINRTKSAEALITPTTAVFGEKPAPAMADFSSRGPNMYCPEILKPDVTAPGVAIVAAYTGARSPTEEDFDHRKTPYITMSGTSMSCPHVAGVVGLLKTMYPKWSPAAIRSAIMTSARTRDNTGHPMKDGFDYSEATPFDYGSGHIQPNHAMNPGLVYDVSIKDHLDFLCGLGYNQTDFHSLVESYTCPDKYSALDYNNPSISVPNLSGSVTVSRRVKNVGKPGLYTSRVRHPAGVSISVEPKVLKFEKIGEEKSFKVTISAKKGVSEYEFGELIWSDGIHYVRSPIVVSSG